MKRLLSVLLILLLPVIACAEENVYRLQTAEGVYLTDVCGDVDVGDEYIAGNNKRYQVEQVEGFTAICSEQGNVELPEVDWLDAIEAVPVSAMTRRIALYCTHSDECYEPSDGTYSTTGRGTIYQVAQTLANALTENGAEATLAQELHHPHDAGAYRRSRQTAVQLLTQVTPDCIIDVHRDGIPDPASYAVTIGGQEVSKIRLLVGRGNQNAEMNKEFALLLKAVGDRIYPGLIKDIYMGKGAFNQDLLPRAILLECGTYTLERERVEASMPLMANVLTRAMYGGVVGSAGQLTNDASPLTTSGITMGEPDAPAMEEKSSGLNSGWVFLGGIVLVCIVLVAFLSAGSMRSGTKKLSRNLSEMTGGLIGQKPDEHEEPPHS